MRDSRKRFPSRKNTKKPGVFNARDLDPRARIAQENRDVGTRSRYKRCSGCKKLRMNRLPGNWWNDYGESQAKRKWKGRRWKSITAGEPKVCHICQHRAENP